MLLKRFWQRASSIRSMAKMYVEGLGYLIVSSGFFNDHFFVLFQVEMKQANPHEKQGGPNMYSNPMNPMMYQQQGEKTFICMPHLLLLIIPIHNWFFLIHVQLL